MEPVIRETKVGEPLLPIIAEVVIAAPIDKVWDVLTGESTVPEWTFCTSKISPVSAEALT